MGCENWFSFAEHRRKRHQVSFKQTRIQLKVLTFAKGQMWACMKKKKKKKPKPKTMANTDTRGFCTYSQGPPSSPPRWGTYKTDWAVAQRKPLSKCRPGEGEAGLPVRKAQAAWLRATCLENKSLKLLREGEQILSPGHRWSYCN